MKKIQHIKHRSAAAAAALAATAGVSFATAGAAQALPNTAQCQSAQAQEAYYLNLSKFYQSIAETDYIVYGEASEAYLLAESNFAIARGNALSAVAQARAYCS